MYAYTFKSFDIAQLISNKHNHLSIFVKYAQYMLKTHNNIANNYCGCRVGLIYVLNVLYMLYTLPYYTFPP